MCDKIIVRSNNLTSSLITDKIEIQVGKNSFIITPDKEEGFVVECKETYMLSWVTPNRAYSEDDREVIKKFYTKNK